MVFSAFRNSLKVGKKKKFPTLEVGNIANDTNGREVVSTVTL